MFDKININGKSRKVFFDEKEMNFYVERKEYKDEAFLINSKIFKLKDYVIYVSYINERAEKYYKYNVICFAYCDDIDLNSFKNITIYSNSFAEILYSNEEKIKEYCIENDDVKYIVSFALSNSYDKIIDFVLYRSYISLNIIRCESWENYKKILDSIIDLIAIVSYKMRDNNIKIDIGCSNAKFEYKKLDGLKNDFSSSCDITMFEKDIESILQTLYKNPLKSIYFIPYYNNTITSLNFLNYYSFFENIIKKGLIPYTEEENENLKAYKLAKKELKKFIKNNNIAVKDEFVKRIDNINPYEGHERKLNRSYSYFKELVPSCFERIGKYINDKELIDYVSSVRNGIIHDGYDGTINENNYYILIFEEMIYALLLKKCSIDDKTIDEICRFLFIPKI